jgi:uncharacterized protein (TIGR00288 family)
MTAQFARPQQRGRPGTGQAHEPHAALLIDFDNVTMGIRSDLTKELKNLLNSDIIKGKVAVQRAYADWRRYPQYIVPLAESSVDLIFAPAYGSAKKNATDIRLAIDAIELVFTRPEIGTIILLSGDSDFSSMVLKLKEYGKYVIGVGIRESASDLLVQNCDEYYSYSALTGLTRAGDEAPAVSEDPWELVEMALRQMRDNDDVMRSDRLKQVLLELDPSFDEKGLGFQKFNKFLQEAAARGLLSLRKQDNGQFEIGPPDALAVAESQAEARGEARRGRGRRGRGRREEGRREEGRERAEPRREQAPAAAVAAPAVPGPGVVAAVAPAADRAKPQPPPERVLAALESPPAKPEAVKPAAEAALPKPEAVKPEPVKLEAVKPEPVKLEAVRPEREVTRPSAEPAKPRPEPVSERPERPTPKPRAAATPEPQAPQIAAEAAVPDTAPVPAVAPRGGRPAPDLAAAYELLRRAASDLVKKSGQAARDSDVKRRMLELESGWDESALGFSKFSRFLRQAHDAEVITLRKGENGVYDVLPGNGESARAEEPRAERERGRGRTGRGRPERERAAAVDGSRAPEQAAARAAPAAPSAKPEATAPRESVRPSPAPPPAPAGAQKAATPPATLMFRRGSRGRGAPSGPPPLLEGQAAAVRLPAQRPPAVTVQPPAAPAPAAAAPSQPERRPAAAAPESIATELGLPQEPGEVASYIASNYKGVGPKSVQTLIDEFGAGRVFDALAKVPDRVRELLGAARGDRLLDAWQEDVRRRHGDTGAATARGGTRKPAKRPAKTGGKSAPAKRGGAKTAAPFTAPPAGSVSVPAAPAPAVATPPAAKSGRSPGGRGSRRGKPPTK